MVYTNNKNTSFFSIKLIVSTLVFGMAMGFVALFLQTTPVAAQTCYSEGDSITPCSGDRAPSGNLQAGKCYKLVDDIEAFWDEINCPAGGQGALIEGPSIEELRIAELNASVENTEANVKANPIYTDLLIPIINFLTAGVGLVVTTLVVVGGIQYMTAGGNPQKTQAAITRIANALIGLVIYIFMFAILQWLIPGGIFG